MKYNIINSAMRSLSVAFCFFVSGVDAIEVFPIIKNVNGNTPRENYVTVKSNFQSNANLSSQSSEKQQYEFVTLELFAIKNPGADKEKFEKVLTQDDPEIVYSPTRLVVPYGEERKVRLMPLKPLDKEKVYRLRIRPSYPEQELDKGKVRFAIGYDVLIRYLPAGKHTMDVAVYCVNDNWMMSAKGNVRSELTNLIIDGKKYPSNFNVYPNYDRPLAVKHSLAFEMDKKLYRYENCHLKD